MVRLLGSLAVVLCLAQVAGGREQEEGTDLLMAATSSSHLLELYSQHHRASLEKFLENPEQSRLLLCQPLYGLANRMRAMMSCFVTALATGRVMLVDWEHQHTKFYENEIMDMPGGQPALLHDLFEPPGFAWDAEEAQGLISDVVANGRILHLADAKERDETLLCRDISSALSEYHVVTLKTYFWWDLVLHNPLYEEKFARLLGRDRIGVINAWKQLGPKLFRPVKDVQNMIVGSFLYWQP
eukprot:763986-Hanusia_phi.AAC.2